MPKPAQRLTNLPPYVFAVIDQQLQQLVASGHDVIRLDIGNPDQPPPQQVIESLSRSATNPNNHGYSGYRGIASFRQAVARYYQRRFGVQLDPETEVLPLLGSKEGIVNLALAYLDRGDGALVPDISYPSYSMGAMLAGAEAHWVHLDSERGFLPDLESIPAAARQQSRLFWVNYPNNPTGATAEAADYARIIEFCAQHDILLASDNPYVDITFDGYRAGSVLENPNAREHAIEFMSLSKSHNMAGWRLGAAVGNAEALRLLLQVKSNVDSGHFKAIYEAGITALDETPDEWIKARNDVYAARRDRIMEVLPQIGLEAETPRATIYVWARVVDGNGASYVEAALRGAYVSIAPGAAYGPGGEHYVRISLGVPDARLDEALDRLIRWSQG